ncbi:MAG TPA: hypothetical protein VNO52_10245, partial [Methylomirabilota bacterium]|nr:hypothetical protein [Methylomirabilota bacterium]
MKPVSVMLIAGEASGDTLAAELVRELRGALISAGDRPTAECQPLRAALAPRFFGAGGPRMAAEGVELAVDLTAHAVVGLIEVLRNLGTFRRLLHRLADLAMERQPDLIVCVD